MDSWRDRIYRAGREAKAIQNILENLKIRVQKLGLDSAASSGNPWLPDSLVNIFLADRAKLSVVRYNGKLYLTAAQVCGTEEEFLPTAVDLATDDLAALVDPLNLNFSSDESLSLIMSPPEDIYSFGQEIMPRVPKTGREPVKKTLSDGLQEVSPEKIIYLNPEDEVGESRPIFKKGTGLFSEGDYRLYQSHIIAKIEATYLAIGTDNTLGIEDFSETLRAAVEKVRSDWANRTSEADPYPSLPSDSPEEEELPYPGPLAPGKEYAPPLGGTVGKYVLSADQARKPAGTTFERFGSTFEVISREEFFEKGPVWQKEYIRRASPLHTKEARQAVREFKEFKDVKKELLSTLSEEEASEAIREYEKRRQPIRVYPELPPPVSKRKCDELAARNMDPDRYGQPKDVDQALASGEPTVREQKLDRKRKTIERHQKIREKAGRLAEGQGKNFNDVQRAENKAVAKDAVKRAEKGDYSGLQQFFPSVSEDRPPSLAERDHMRRASGKGRFWEGLG